MTSSPDVALWLEEEKEKKEPQATISATPPTSSSSFSNIIVSSSNNDDDDVGGGRGCEYVGDECEGLARAVSSTDNNTSCQLSCLSRWTTNQPRMDLT
eukprot:CAMPEP_0201721554 /NCGR_PEP_ID=MMETSP0593-20130828/6205_1 /ASSEMBLY_ACC=CAM_ASM_000672 /TAXON_ID=267983 /ORGANISM="Skeletonema japonicum, Strain CCMP2506" /LENGTH=97 /DNA_ID=CAMNT_0048212385 /DNA_START=734 /DNA_END=1026 /DNA_ORIENTATION=+